MRIAIVGTYRSGSSAVAGILHHLGVDLGGPFWGNHFESQELAAMLRRWWCEPQLVAALPAKQRQLQLAQWIEKREKASPIVGAKHPLLALCLEDLAQGWGENARFVWCKRPIDQAVASLAKRGWWPDSERIQRKLHDALDSFMETQSHIAVDFAETANDPEGQIRRIVAQLNLQPSAEQLAAAIHWVTHQSGDDAGDSRANGERASAAQAHGELTDQAQAVAAQVSDVQTVSESTPPRTTKIVATLLCGNSESIVGAAVRSVIDWVDEVCLIDTGITDRSLAEVTKVAGDKLSRTSYAWTNDFAAARNAALEAADRAGASWALTIDTDERIEFSNYQSRSQLLATLESDPLVRAWMVSAHDGSYSKERFLRVPTKLRWSGRTHEALVGSGANERRVLSGCTFWEEHKSEEAYRHKVERDLNILLAETAAQPFNPRWWYYLGQTYEGLKQFRRAVEALDRCIRLDGWAEESAWACYVAARCLVALDEFREAEEYCSLGLTRKPTVPELPWLAGWCALKRGAASDAVMWCKLAIVIARDNTGGNAAIFRHLPAWYEAPYDVLRFAYRKLAAPALAEQAELDYHAAQAARLRAHPTLR